MVVGSSPVTVTWTSDSALASSKEFLDIQATIECGFTLKRGRDMIRTYSQNTFALDLIWNQMDSSAIWFKLEFLWHLHEFNSISSEVSSFLVSFHSSVRYYVCFYGKWNFNIKWNKFSKSLSLFYIWLFLPGNFRIKGLPAIKYSQRLVWIARKFYDIYHYPMMVLFIYKKLMPLMLYWYKL